MRGDERKRERIAAPCCPYKLAELVCGTNISSPPSTLTLALVLLGCHQPIAPNFQYT